MQLSDDKVILVDLKRKMFIEYSIASSLIEFQKLLEKTRGLKLSIVHNDPNEFHKQHCPEFRFK